MRLRHLFRFSPINTEGTCLHRIEKNLLKPESDFERAFRPPILDRLSRERKWRWYCNLALNMGPVATTFAVYRSALESGKLHYLRKSGNFRPSELRFYRHILTAVGWKESPPRTTLDQKTVRSNAQAMKRLTDWLTYANRIIASKRDHYQPPARA